MTWVGVGVTHIGQVRTTNQDAYLVNNKRGLWMVADGMGSHAHSGIASQLAIEAINTFLETQSPSDSLFDAHQWQILLRNAVSHANDRIHAQCHAQPELAGMGTTVVLAFMPHPIFLDMHIVHAGDSRAYLWRDSTLTLLTPDHTLLEERIRDGVLPKDTPASHKLGHVLTKAVGIEATVKADCLHITLQPTDTILLCSDGLNKRMNDEEILNLLLKSRHDKKQNPCQTLIEEANRLGGHDNVTVVVVKKKKDR